jgi:hypothetical protein
VEPVDTVVRDRDGDDLALSQCRDDIRDRQCSSSIEVANAGKVFTDKPERLPDVLVPGENHNSPLRYSAHFSEALGWISPVMHGEDGKGGVNGAID